MACRSSPRTSPLAKNMSRFQNFIHNFRSRFPSRYASLCLANTVSIHSLALMAARSFLVPVHRKFTLDAAFNFDKERVSLNEAILSINQLLSYGCFGPPLLLLSNCHC